MENNSYDRFSLWVSPVTPLIENEYRIQYVPSESLVILIQYVIVNCTMGDRQ